MLIREIDLPGNATIVDAPSGDGIVSYWLSKRIRNRFELYDNSEYVLAKAALRMKDKSVPLFLSDVSEIPVESQEGDLWLLINSLYLFENPAPVVERLKVRMKWIIGIFPYTDHQNYIAYMKSNKDCSNPGVMNKNETIRFFENIGYRALKQKDVTFLNIHNIKPYLLKIGCIYFYNLWEKFSSKSSAAYWVCIFERK